MPKPVPKLAKDSTTEHSATKDSTTKDSATKDSATKDSTSATPLNAELAHPRSSIVVWFAPLLVDHARWDCPISGTTHSQRSAARWA